ncbi:hypothetical protein CCHR01_12969 [Colletotrichum chrysophilum]|uniref:Uncharacterized protein n=1 Tax=Colletotrichum chrysophilum TaxID=1836956 RepID=A0AAD9AAU1_9PEZI|nr:hypothetical protein CCHR01_12969 [Colletotrichum chrysophilum]
MKTRPEISGNIEPYFWCIVSLEEEARGVASDGQATAKGTRGPSETNINNSPLLLPFLQIITT